MIGSQAIHGSFPDPDLDVVLRSDDLDIYPRDGYTPTVYEELMLHLGQDSDYHLETGHYIEAVETIDHETLRERYAVAPRITKERRDEGLTDIQNACRGC